MLWDIVYGNWLNVKGTPRLCCGMHNLYDYTWRPWESGSVRRQITLLLCSKLSRNSTLCSLDVQAVLQPPNLCTAAFLYLESSLPFSHPNLPRGFTQMLPFQWGLPWPLVLNCNYLQFPLLHPQHPTPCSFFFFFFALLLVSFPHGISFNLLKSSVYLQNRS